MVRIRCADARLADLKLAGQAHAKTAVKNCQEIDSAGEIDC